MSTPRKCEASNKAIVVAQLVVCALVLNFVPQAYAKKHQSASINEFGNWPRGTSPQEIGKGVGERYVASDYINLHRHPPTPTIIYPEVCTWYGALTFAQLTHDSDLTQRLIKRFEPLFGEKASLIPKPNHVDKTVFGTVPLEIYIETKDPKYLELRKSIADARGQDPTVDGLTTQTRCWIDDMYMITAVEVQAYRATGDRKYLDRAAHEMSVYLDKLQQPNGLFYHPDVPSFWGRENGWIAAARPNFCAPCPKIILSERTSSTPTARCWRRC
jgi:hypothetical protein